MKFVLRGYFAVLCLIALSYSQSFMWNAPHLTMNGNPGDFLSNHTYLENISSNPVDLRIIILETNMPATWNGAYCPPYACLPFTIDTSDVFTVAANTTDSLLIDFGTDPVTPGIGTAKVKVENANNAAEFFIYDFTASTFPNAIGDISANISESFRLLQNYPNPFNPSTTIPFEITAAQSKLVKLNIFNLLGQHIKTLVDDKLQPGYFEISWDASDQDGKMVPNGFYFYELKSGDTRLLGKMVFMK